MYICICICIFIYIQSALITKRICVEAQHDSFVMIVGALVTWAIYTQG